MESLSSGQTVHLRSDAAAEVAKQQEKTPRRSLQPSFFQFTDSVQSLLTGRLVIVSQLTAQLLCQPKNGFKFLFFKI